jgi:hypothetical protein
MTSTTHDTIRAAAAAEVQSELKDISDPYERRAKAKQLHEQAQVELAAVRPERDQLLAAAALAEGRVTPELARDMGVAFSYALRVVHNQLGSHLSSGRWWSQANLASTRARAAHAGIPYTDPDIHKEAVKAGVRFEAAEARRDAAAVHLEAAQEAVRTEGGRKHVPAPARPDFDAIRRRAREEINAEFAKLTVAPEERLRLAGETVDQAEEEAAALLPERDAALCSLAFYTTARALYESAGLTRQGLLRVQQRALSLSRDSKLPARAEQPAAARAAGVPYLPDASQELPDIAAAYEAAQARRSTAIEIRDAAIRALHAADPERWTPPKLAEVIDRDRVIVHRALKAGDEQT